MLRKSKILKNLFVPILCFLLSISFFSVPIITEAKVPDIDENIAGIESVIVSNCENKEISNLLYNYYKLKYKMLTTFIYDNGIEKYIATDCDEDIIQQLYINHCKMQLKDIKLKNCNIVIVVNDLVYTNNKYVVTFDEKSKYKYNFSTDDIFTEEVVEHTVTINENMQILYDEYDNDFKEEYENLLSGGLSSQKCVNTILQKSQARVEETKRLKKELYKRYLENKIDISTENAENQMMGVTTLAAAKSGFTRHAYNRNYAANYALKYALNPNKNYLNMETMGGDCTNFTSQCLKAGGIVADKTGSYKWYYTNANDRAPAWSDAQQFRIYYHSNVGSANVKGIRANTSTFANARLGDIVQWVVNKKAKHSMIIDGAYYEPWAFNDPWKYKTDVYICQHSTGKSGRAKHKLLSTKNIAKNQLEYVHIDSSYY